MQGNFFARACSEVNGRLRKERHEEAREKLGRDTSYTVAKNTLFRIAAKEAGIEGLDEMLKGPSAVVFVDGDFIEAAKVLRDFAKTNKALIVKGGFADGTVYDAEGAKQLADLKSRPEQGCAHDRRPARQAGEGCLRPIASRRESCIFRKTTKFEVLATTQ